MNEDVPRIQLLHGKVLILRDKTKSKTDGGILLPASSVKSELGIGVVVRGHNGFKEGDHVLFLKYSGYDVDENYVAVDPKDLIAIYDTETAVSHENI